MIVYPKYLKLGCAKAEKFGIGNKASLLDLAVAGGFSVPFGIIVLHETFKSLQDEEILSIENGKVKVVDRRSLLAYLNLPEMAGKVAVRSAFSIEDGQEKTLAGRFASKLNVNFDSDSELTEAMADVWSSGLPYEEDCRFDILIMEMVQPSSKSSSVISGVAFTQKDYEDDLVEYTLGYADRLLAGKEIGKSELIPKLRLWERKLIKKTWQARLQATLRKARSAFDEDNWDIEWVDDGSRCYIVQIRPITSKIRRNELFTIANHKEILPPLPSFLMSSLIESCAPKLFGYYRDFDSSLPSERPFIELFAGRPYINLSLMTEMMRIFGLPTNLVTESIGGSNDRSFPMNFLRMLGKWQTLLKLFFAQIKSSGSALNAIRYMREEAGKSLNSFEKCTDCLAEVYVRLVREMFSLTSAMSAPLFILKKLNVLAELSATNRSISSQMFTDLREMVNYMNANPDLRDSLKEGIIPQERTFELLWKNYLEKYGHRGVYESDIALPRFCESPDELIKALLCFNDEPKRHHLLSFLAFLCLPLWWTVKRNLNIREELRHEAMKVFLKIRLNILRLADSAVQSKQLPHAKAIWDLTIAELSDLDAGVGFSSRFFDDRDALIEELKNYELPDLIYRFDNLEKFSIQNRQSETDNSQGLPISGSVISLAEGKVQGKAWVLQEPSSSLPEGFNPAETILVARSIDAGWIPTFACVAGVVVETGGLLSHGSIILREIGLPSLTNVADSTKIFKTGDNLILDSKKNFVRKQDVIDG